MIENILLILLILLLGAKIVGTIFEKIGLDSTIGQLVVGIVLGPSVFNLIHPDSVEAFAIIGSILILFIAGLKQRGITEIYKDKPSLKMGLWLLVIPLVFMTVFFYFASSYFGITLTILQSLILALAFSIVDIGVPAKVMLQNRLINKPVGRIAVRSSIVNIIAGLLLFVIFTLFIDFNVTLISFRVVAIALFFLATVLLVYFLARIARFVRKLHIHEAEFSLAIILILALAYLTEIIGFTSVLGAFLAGVLISLVPFAETRSFSSKIESLSFGLFIPLFFVWFGLTVNLTEVWKHLGFAILIFLVYAIPRFIITFVGARKMKERSVMSASMLSVDVESLVVIVVALQFGIFTTTTPLALFATVVVIGMFVHLVLTKFFSRRLRARG